MDKFKKFDDIDIFPDVKIEPDIQDIIEEQPSSPEPRPERRENDEIFKDKGPVIVDEIKTEIDGDTADTMASEAMEILEPVKKRGRGKDKQKRKINQSQAQKDALARGRKNRWEKDKAHRIAYREQEAKKEEKKEALYQKDLEKELETKKEEERKRTIELKITKKPVLQQCHRPGRPNSIPDDFGTFCDYMDRYKQSRKSAKNQAHPNKMVNKNLLPRAPMVSAPRTLDQKKTNQILMDPNYAMNMLGARARKSQFKDPFSRF